MSDLTTDGRASTPRGGLSGVALELLSSGARGALKAPLSALRLPLAGIAQICSVTDAVRRNYLSLAERGLGLVGLRSHLGDDATSDPTGYLAEAESRNGEYAEFSPEFAAPTGTGAMGAGHSEMMADADADLIAELGTDFGADLDSVSTSATDSIDAQWSTEDLQAAGAGLEAAADTINPLAPGKPLTGGIAAAGVQGSALVDSKPVDSKPVDIVTRAALAAEDAVADDSLPQLDRDELPIEDFDHVTAGSLRGRLRRLGLPDLRVLRMYEQDHGRRLPILTLLENRIAKLEAAATV